MRTNDFHLATIHNCSLAYAKSFQFADLTCCCSPARHSDKLAYSYEKLLRDLREYANLLRDCEVFCGITAFV